MTKQFKTLRQDMSKYYGDKSLGIGKPKTFNPKTQKFEEDAPTNSAGAGNVAGIGVGPDGEPGIRRKKKEFLTKKISYQESISGFKNNNLVRIIRIIHCLKAS